MTDYENGVPPEDGTEGGEDIRETPEPPKTFAQRHEELIRKANGGRGSLLIIFCAAMLNILLLMAGNSTMSFSMALPQQSILWARLLVDRTGNRAMGGALIILGAVVLLSMLVMWLLSKRDVRFVIAFLAVYALDTVLLITFTTTDIQHYILDYLFHAWGLFAVSDVLRSRLKLNRLWRDEEGDKGQWPG